MIATIEDVLGVSARRNYQPVPSSDVPQTWANIEKAGRLLGYRPKVGFREGIQQFIDWIKNNR
jgi:UDP-glucuronate 4-epimerase